MKREFMKDIAVMAFAAAAAVAWSGAWAQQHASAKEAEAMVKKGVAFIKASGKEKGYAEISSKQSKFKDRDLYLVVYGLDGKVLADGANEKMIGYNMIDVKDIDGKEFVKERVELATQQPSFWQSYKFMNPVTHKVEAKTAYWERVGDLVFSSGAYKPL